VHKGRKVDSGRHKNGMGRCCPTKGGARQVTAATGCCCNKQYGSIKAFGLETEEQRPQLELCQSAHTEG